jgi:hypothetical protein
MRRDEGDGRPTRWPEPAHSPPPLGCELVAYSQPIAIMLSKTASAVAWSPTST